MLYTIEYNVTYTSGILKGLTMPTTLKNASLKTVNVLKRKMKLEQEVKAMGGGKYTLEVTSVTTQNGPVSL